MEMRVVGPGNPIKDDQVFTVEGIGNFNVSMVLRAIDERPEDFIFCRSPLTQETIDYIWRSNDPDKEYLATMTREQVDRGFAVAIQVTDGGEEEPVQLIDGNHYLLKAWEFGEREMRVVIVPKAMVARFMFEYEIRWMPGGAWTKVSAEEVVGTIHGVYSRPDGTLRDRENRVVARRKA